MTLEPLKCRAAVAYAPNQALVVEEIIVGPPKSGEIRVKMLATGTS